MASRRSKASCRLGEAATDRSRTSPSTSGPGLPGIPALTGVLMNASGTELVLATTDLEVSARLRLEVQVQEEGVALIPARLLADMVKSFEQAPVIVEADGGQARIVCSNYEGTVRCLPAEDFPALQDPGGTRVTVDAAGFAEGVG